MSNDLYFKFDGYVFNDAYIITSIEKSLLPSREYNTINIPTIDGERLNGVKYTPLVYTITLLIEGDDIEHRNLLKRTLRDLLKTKQQVPVAFNERTFGYGMVTSEVELVNRTQTQATAKFELTCFMPFFYANSVNLFDDVGGTIQIVNSGGEKVKPFITVGFTKDAHFCQLENTRTGEKLLVGNYPSLNTSNTYKEKETIGYSNCESTQGWSQSSASIDSDRTTGGTIAIANNGNGLILGSIPSGSTTWKGACYRFNLGESAEEFTVAANIDFHATGVNADPTVLKLEEQEITSGSRTYYYEVTASALNVRTGPGTNYKSLGTVARGYKITISGGASEGTMVNGWAKFKDTKKFGDQYVYCSNKYLTKKVKDSTSTTKLQNWVVTNKLGAALCSSPNWGTNNSYGTQLCRIPVGTVLRLIVSNPFVEKWTGSDGQARQRTWYQLYTAYNGKMGYVAMADCTRADQAVIEYDEADMVETADDKTGLIEVYGFDTQGSKLFSMVVADWNKYYECVVPRCEVGQTTIMGTNGSEVPAPKSENIANSNDGTTTITTKYKLSGKYGDWNDFWGKFTVTRRTVNGKQVWSANLVRIDNGVVTKSMSVSNKSSSNFPTGQLSYIILYIGTTGDVSKSCDMALTDLICYKYNKPSSNEYKATYFQEGDILDIDFDNRQVYLNEQPCNELLDIGSRFFDVDTGITNIKVISDDGSAVSSAVIREKWVGDE